MRRKEIKEKNKATPLNPKENLFSESSIFHRCRIPMLLLMVAGSGLMFIFTSGGLEFNIFL
jgi:hypothetical protein